MIPPVSEKMRVLTKCHLNHCHEVGLAVDQPVHPAVRWTQPSSDDWSQELFGCTIPADTAIRAMLEFHLHPEAAIRQGFVSLGNAA